MPRIILVILGVLTIIAFSRAQCNFTAYEKFNQKYVDLAVSRLKRLVGQRFSVTDQSSTENYVYNLGICTQADSNVEGYPDSGILQVITDKSGKVSQRHNLGNYTRARIMNGTDWVILEYMDGDNYSSHCQKGPRKSTIMITCGPGKTQGNARFVVENADRDSECFYLFEIEHEDVCSRREPRIMGLSAGSVICIIFVTLVALYLLVGFLYSRFLLGHKGFNQIPNYEFWQDFGNLQADGCDLLCRSGNRRGYNEPRLYKGIGDDQLHDEDGGAADENLLPM